MDIPLKPVNYRWAQGEDLIIELAYKEGPDASSAVILPLSAGYKIRMDIVTPETKQSVYTASSDVAGTTILANTAPNITIVLHRALNLPGGALYQNLSETNSFAFDLFLRNIQTDRQVKILKGSIISESSNTLWA